MNKLMLDGISAVGVSDSVKFNHFIKNHTISVWYVDVNASVSDVIIDLEGSLDPTITLDADIEWFIVAQYQFESAEITAKKAIFHIINRMIVRARLKLSTYTGGVVNTDLLYARYLGGNL